MSVPEAKYDILGIGNAIVDVIARADDDFLVKQDMRKGGMSLIDEARAQSIYDAMGSAVEISGGSAANTMAGLASLGRRAGFVGKVKNDDAGREFSKTYGPFFVYANRYQGAATDPTDKVTEALWRSRGAILLDDIGPAILVTHGDGEIFARVTAEARPALVKGAVKVESMQPSREWIAKAVDPLAPAPAEGLGRLVQGEGARHGPGRVVRLVPRRAEQHVQGVADDLGHQREAESGSFGFRGHERIEQMRAEFFRDAAAVVLDRNDGLAAVHGQAQAQASVLLGVLGGVVQDVADDLHQPLPVAHDEGRPGRDLRVQAVAPCLDQRRHLLDRLVQFVHGVGVLARGRVAIPGHLATGVGQLDQHPLGHLGARPVRHGMHASHRVVHMLAVVERFLVRPVPAREELRVLLLNVR